MRRVHLQSKDSIEYVCIYLLLLLKSGFFFVENMSAITAPVFLAILAVFCMIRHKSMNRKTVYITLSLLGLIVFTQLITNSLWMSDELNKMVLTTINILTSLLIVTLISLEDFKNKFCNIIWIISTFSIVGWILMTLLPQVAYSFPTLTNSVGVQGYFALLNIMVDYSFTGAKRVQGIFWEPGAFQTMIVIAMIIEYSFGIDKRKWAKYAVYVCAGALTLSTTGLLCILLVLLLYMNKNAKHIIKIIIILVIAIVAYFHFSEKASGFLYYTLYGKVESMLSYQLGTTTNVSSRLDSIILPLRGFFESPLWGVGTAGYASFSNVIRHSMFTCTPINYFAYYGLVFGTICFYGYGLLVKMVDETWWKRIWIAVCLMLSVASEEFMLNPLMIAFILYGYQSIGKKRVTTCYGD